MAKSGNWWLPDRQEKQFYGELSFNQSDGGTLILSDTLDKLYDFPTRNEDFIILGNFTEELKNEVKTIDSKLVMLSLLPATSAADAKPPYAANYPQVSQGCQVGDG